MPARSGVTFQPLRRNVLLGVLERRAERAGQVLAADLRQTLSRRQATRRTAPGGHLRARRRARPGAPPRALTQELARSVAHRVIRRSKEVALRVGVQAFYGRFLELNGHPFLRPLLRRRRARIRRILLRGGT